MPFYALSNFKQNSIIFKISILLNSLFVVIVHTSISSYSIVFKMLHHHHNMCEKQNLFKQQGMQQNVCFFMTFHRFIMKYSSLLLLLIFILLTFRYPVLEINCTSVVLSNGDMLWLSVWSDCQMNCLLCKKLGLVGQLVNPIHHPHEVEGQVELVNMALTLIGCFYTLIWNVYITCSVTLYQMGIGLLSSGIVHFGSFFCLAWWKCFVFDV